MEKITAKQACEELQEYRKLILESPSDSVMDTGALMAKAFVLFQQMEQKICSKYGTQFKDTLCI